MIFGIGTDLIEVERVSDKMQNSPGFKELVFTPAEISYCEMKTYKYEHYAARFAAKEAFLKAIGTGWRSGTAFNEIEVYNDEQGKPELRFYGITEKTVEKMKIGNIFVSLSHLKSVACAMVILENI